MLLAINGKSLSDDPVSVIRGVHTSANPVALSVRRGEEALTIDVTPERSQDMVVAAITHAVRPAAEPDID